jgi:hypothetical protein
VERVIKPLIRSEALQRDARQRKWNFIKFNRRAGKRRTQKKLLMTFGKRIDFHLEPLENVYGFVPIDRSVIAQINSSLSRGKQLIKRPSATHSNANSVSFPSTSLASDFSDVNENRNAVGDSIAILRCYQSRRFVYTNHIVPMTSSDTFCIGFLYSIFLSFLTELRENIANDGLPYLCKSFYY